MKKNKSEEIQARCGFFKGSWIESFMPTANELDTLARKPIVSSLSTNAAATVFAGRKNCSTRHGCTGATNCNYAYGDYK